MSNKFFNAHHAPIGAFATFTLGFRGAAGGPAIELGRPANQDVFIGLEGDKNHFSFLPFYKDARPAEVDRFTPEAQKPDPKVIRVDSFSEEEIQREFHLGTDTWTAGDLTFRIYTPFKSIPDPETSHSDDLRSALVPAVICELSVDNRNNAAARRAVFGFQGNDPYSGMRALDETLDEGLSGFGQGRHVGAVTSHPFAYSALGFSIVDILSAAPNNRWFGIGQVGALIFTAPAHTVTTFRIAVSFFRNGLVTSGLDCKYYYTRLFKDVEGVASFAIDHSDSIISAALKSNELLDRSALSPDRKFMLAHAVHSYYGSTQLLDHAGKPLWIVNEGEYRMMNTLDLTADHLFFELRMNPWVVRSALDLFADRYSYVDEVQFRGSDTKYPGGVSFVHDMGVANVFSRSGYSSYEKSGIDDCFSYMTQEQLVNWTLCASSYIAYTGDFDWRTRRIDLLKQCLQSLLNRDDPQPERRNGLMGLDSSRCAGGAEITTYDALDTSLGQARNNLYLAVKTWAAYVLLSKLFHSISEEAFAAEAKQQSMRCIATIVGASRGDGSIPAVIGEGVESDIIPAVEGLIFPLFLGYTDVFDSQGTSSELIDALRKHFKQVLTPGRCLFADGGWKLSSTSDNSWLSKIYLSQHVVRKALGMDSDAVSETADAAHVRWLLDKEYSYYAWSDQMIAGKAMASRYYPRGVTAILWLDE